MPALVFPREHGPALRTGAQLITLARPRSDAAGASNAHAAVGDDVQIDLAARKPLKRERIDTRRCILRASVVMTADALLAVSGVRYRPSDGWTDQAQMIERFLSAAVNGAPGDLSVPRDALAQLAGFKSWGAAWAYAAEYGRGDVDEHGRIRRELIGWSRPGSGRA